jgi:predicted HTH transcriptional regulator
MFLPKKNNQWIQALLSKPEGIQLDFKQNISNQKKIAKTFLAFANTEGGLAVIGVADNKQIIGIDPEEEMYMAREALRKFCKPEINLTFDVYEIYEKSENDQLIEKYILVIHVPKSNDQLHALKTQGEPPVYYKRIKDRSIPFKTNQG